jgi:hypothetical protein
VLAVAGFWQRAQAVVDEILAADPVRCKTKPSEGRA